MKYPNWMKDICRKTEAETLVLGAVDGIDVKALDFHNFDFQATGSGSKRGLNSSSYFSEPELGSLVSLSTEQTPLFSYYREHMGVSPYSSAKLLNISISMNTEDLVRVVSKYRDLDTGKVDWLSVSSEMNEKSSQHSALPIEYYLQFRAHCEYDNAEIATFARWAAEEDAKLLALIREHEERNWVVIASKLGTRRTPLDCIRRYQQALNTEVIKVNDWTADEESLLRAAVSIHGPKKWQKVSDSVPGRSAYQCQLKWRRFVNTEDQSDSTAKWAEGDERRLYLSAASHGVVPMDASKRSPAEVQALLEAIRGSPDSSIHHLTISADRRQQPRSKRTPERTRYSWMDVSRVIPGKSDSRCRDKWMSSLDNSIETKTWTSDEDSILRYLIQHSAAGSWNGNAEWFPGRTDAQVAKRWQLISNESGPRKDTKKRKMVLPPAMKRKVNASQLDVDDFVPILQKRL